MNRKHLLANLCCVLAAIATPADAYECPVTIPGEDAVSLAPDYKGKEQWYGSPRLAALIPPDGHWRGMGSAHNFRAKFWWWRAGFDPSIDRFPTLEVTARRLDQTADPITASRAAASNRKGWDTMLVLMRFPEAGCWRVTGSYLGESLDITLDVSD